jgi:hypothetical protein
MYEESREETGEETKNALEHPQKQSTRRSQTGGVGQLHVHALAGRERISIIVDNIPGGCRSTSAHTVSRDRWSEKNTEAKKKTPSHTSRSISLYSAPKR